MKSSARGQTLAKLNDEAIALFYAGRLKEAETICAKILRNTPQSAQTLIILSVIRATQGNLEEAVKLTNRAIAYAPKLLDGYVNRSNYLQQLGRFAEALESCRQALAIDPDFIPALLSACGAYIGLREFAAAFEPLRHVEQLQPELPMVAFRKGDVHFHLGDFAQALQAYDQALRQMPQSVELVQNRAMALRGLGRFEEALAACDAGLALAPQHIGLLHVRATILQNLEQIDAAAAAYAQVIALMPTHFDSHHDSARALQKLGRYDAALAHAHTAVALRPDSAEAHNTYANCLMALDRPEEALVGYAQALRLAPELYTTHNNYSNALYRVGQYAQSLAGYDAAIGLMPSSSAAYSGKGTVMHALGRHLEASINFNRALELEPESALAQFNKAMQRLLFGNFEEGWQLYESRWRKPGQLPDRELTQPLWLGQQDIRGKTILLHAEQGLGDSIQFCRYVPMVETLGARVILEVQAPLVRLMQTLPGTRTVIARGDALPAFDVQCPLMSLPLAFNTRLETIPNAVPYLAAPAHVLAKWQARLGATQRLRVGLAWSGSKKHQHDHLRSIVLETLAPLLALDAEFHVLQNDVRANDASFLAAHPQVRVHGEALHDMAEAAGLMAAMDVVIGVDTSLVHLAGAMAKPVWVMLPFAPDFRWLLERAESPWYPSATLLRQAEIGNWEPVVTQVVAKLGQEIQAR